MEISIHNLRPEHISGAVSAYMLAPAQYRLGEIPAVASIDAVPDSATRIALSPAERTKLDGLVEGQIAAVRPIDVVYQFLTSPLTSTATPPDIREYNNEIWRRRVSFQNALAMKASIITGGSKPDVYVLFQYLDGSNWFTLSGLELPISPSDSLVTTGWVEVPSEVKAQEFVTVRYASMGGDGTENISTREVCLTVRIAS